MAAISAREKVVERLVSWIWEQQAVVGPLPADDGHQYQVVFRGRPWGQERRPDFQGALLARDDGLLLRGDIELHVRASDWQRHGHSRDEAYNSAICQVALWRDETPVVRRQDGAAIPTLELVTRLAAPLSELERRAGLDTAPRPRPPELPCVRSEDDLVRLLDRAGVARFLEHAAGFEGDLAALPAEEVLYRGALRAMGYTANTVGFEQLGAVLPLATLQSAASGRGAARLVSLQATMLGMAGLLPSQRGIAADAAWASELEAAWSQHASALPAPLGNGVWRSWRVRPENVPVRRAAGMSVLAAAWTDGDPLGHVLGDLDTAQRSGRTGPLAARWVARVPDDAFWATHHDFGRPLKEPQPWLVGAGRAGEVVVNVVLPFAYALGQARGDQPLAERALGLYRQYPSGPPNRVVREMAVQVGGAAGPKLARGACRQQGLIHLYKHWCDSRDCQRCAAGPG
ncbi:MAG: DUF2851 family protein [Chloroflexi bacterium]|nr:DUF2851 family protein [Chloroflexota bacterium]